MEPETDARVTESAKVRLPAQPYATTAYSRGVLDELRPWLPPVAVNPGRDPSRDMSERQGGEWAAELTFDLRAAAALPDRAT